MLVKVYRYEEGVCAPHYESYTVPYPSDGSVSIMDVLDYISKQLDPTLAYYRHSACNRGICGRCLLRVNGKMALACITRADTEPLILEPASTKPVRDLVSP